MKQPAILHESFGKRFRCPQCVPCSEEGDQFCSPYQCPEQIPQPRFPSPNSSLPQDELEDYEACIAEANLLLQTLGNPRDEEEEHQRALQLELRKLRGQFVKVTYRCGDEEQGEIGELLDAGINFIILSDLNKKTIIPFNRICTIEHAMRHDGGHEPELIAIDRCLRREIVLNFAETVSKSPYLINLFFGIDLSLFLESFVDCQIFVQFEDGGDVREINGLLIDVEEDEIVLNVESEDDPLGVESEDEPLEIELESICKLVIR